MSTLRASGVAAVAAAICFAVPSMASEVVGQAVLIKTKVTGQSGPLSVKEPVHRDERISTSASGLGQFLFNDGTKFVVGGGSSVVIDRFVFDNSNSAKTFSRSRPPREHFAGSAAARNPRPTRSRRQLGRSVSAEPRSISTSVPTGPPPSCC